MGEQQELGKVSTAELQRELARRESAADKAVSRREEILKELAEVERELKALGSRSNGHKPVVSSGVKPLELAPRPRRASPSETTKRNAGLTLHDAMLVASNVGQRYTPTQVADALKATGYVSGVKKLNMPVSSEMTKRTDHWKKVMRGLYERIK